MTHSDLVVQCMTTDYHFAYRYVFMLCIMGRIWQFLLATDNRNDQGQQGVTLHVTVM
jgi:hypothetical protein